MVLAFFKTLAVKGERSEVKGLSWRSGAFAFALGIAPLSGLFQQFQGQQRS